MTPKQRYFDLKAKVKSGIRLNLPDWIWMRQFEKAQRAHKQRSALWKYGDSQRIPGNYQARL